MFFAFEHQGEKWDETSVHVAVCVARRRFPWRPADEAFSWEGGGECDCSVHKCDTDVMRLSTV